MPAGGYRRPANPAAVSGPGTLSRRTDGGPGQPIMQTTGGAYGDATAFRSQEQAAPMARAQQAPIGGPVPMSPDAAQQSPSGPAVVGLHEPTQFPNEPITAGAPFGPGAGRPPSRSGFRVTDQLKALLGSDVAGDLADLYLQAERMGL